MEFVTVHIFQSRIEAEMAGEILERAGIPFLIQSEDIGIFGPGGGAIPSGAQLRARGEDLADARILLTGLI